MDVNTVPVASVSSSETRIPSLTTTENEEKRLKAEPGVRIQRQVNDRPDSDELDAAASTGQMASENSSAESRGSCAEEFSSPRPRVLTRTRKLNLLKREPVQKERETHGEQEETEHKKVAELENESKKICDGDGGVGLKKELGLVDCVGLIVGNIIGTGIFVSPRAVLHYTGSVGMSLSVWVASGVVAMFGALCFAELGMMIPQSGGNYTYIHEAFGPIPAFLYLWVAVVVSIPTNRAIAALTFANYCLQPFFPDCQEPPQSALRIVGILIIVLLTWVNSRRVKWATSVQDMLALTKVLALIMIIGIGINRLAWGGTHNYDDPMEGTNWNPVFIATAFYHTLFAYDGWDSLNMVREELKDPVRNMPRAIAISLSSVIVIYILTNVAYFAILTPEQMLTSTAVAVTFGNLTLGVMAWMIPIFVACSTGGALNGSVFSSARLLFVSSRRGQLPKVFSYVHAQNCTPIPALVFITCLSMVMFVTSDVRTLINYLAFSSNLLGLTCIGSFFWFRLKQPERDRPIKVWIIFPIVYFIISVFLTVFPVIRQPLEVLAALVAIGTGLPVYYLTIHRKEKPQKLRNAMDKVTYLCQMLFLSVPEEKTG
ncbi:Y+L amino acid transporter 2-like [Cherax quadricarinatus]|uniref:Y+L amino acid transporter 2-like n=1 Tax=Cherax quadricarinatus TaxID=27406 RepID=UPI00387E7F5B